MTESFGGYASEDSFPEINTPEADAAPSELSLLDELEAELNETKTDRVRFPVAKRPGWVLEFLPVVGAPQIKRYNDTAKGKGKAENADARVSNGMALLEANTGIFKEINGELVQLTDEKGADLKLNSTKWLSMLKEPSSSPNAVRALCKFMDDAGVIAMGAALLREAGWADDLTPLDPTNG